MDELDARLRAMAKREDWALPAAYESAMDGLEEQIRQSTLDRPGKRRLGKRVLLLAAALAVLACGFAVAAERMGWLSPVVDDGGSGGRAISAGSGAGFDDGSVLGYAGDVRGDGACNFERYGKKCRSLQGGCCR